MRANKGREWSRYLIAREADDRLLVTFVRPETAEALGVDGETLLGADPAAVLKGRTFVEVPLPDGQVMVVLEDGLAGDELRQANFDLQQALQAANAASEAKTSFLSNMSHDIRTPMNAIIGMTNIALNHLDEKARVRDCLGKIKSASDHLMSLINDVLDMSRIDSGKTTINEEQFSLADLVHDLGVLLRPLAQAKGQTLTLDVSGILHEELMGDALYLRQVFVNIINNAIKYTQEGGAIHVEMSQRHMDGPGQIMLDFSCRDNGIGMSEEFLQRIFLPFERAANSTLGKVEGTGLGMAITRSLVEQMGGSIHVESELGKGSVFTVSLPLSVSSVQEEVISLAGRTVLTVIPDEAQSRMVAGYIRENAGEVVEQRSGTDAVLWVTQAEMEHTRVDAIVLSNTMGQNAALDLANHLHDQLGGQIPILYLSNEDWSQFEYAARRAGITDFVPVPIFRGRLVKALLGESGEEVADVRPDFAGMRILLAEDNMLNREIAVEIIGETGAQVDAVEDGKEALDTFAASAENYYDLVLMDIQMPVMDGYEAVRRIRALDRPDAKKVTIAAMTANAFVEDIKKTRAAGMDEHLAKPVNVKLLEELLRRCYRRE